MFRRRTAARQKSAGETREHEKSPDDKSCKAKIKSIRKTREYHRLNDERGARHFVTSSNCTTGTDASKRIKRIFLPLLLVWFAFCHLNGIWSFDQEIERQRRAACGLHSDACLTIRQGIRFAIAVSVHRAPCWFVFSARGGGWLEYSAHLFISHVNEIGLGSPVYTEILLFELQESVFSAFWPFFHFRINEIFFKAKNVNKSCNVCRFN